jgi:uncharacterized protein (DUF1778 family)
VNLRVEPQVKAILVRAARLHGVKLTEFMIKSSRAAAENALADRTRFLLPSDQWRAFHAALDAPSRAIPALRKLLAAPPVFKPA